jgi:hypothetical protein
VAALYLGAGDQARLLQDVAEFRFGESPLAQTPVQFPYLSGHGLDELIWSFGAEATSNHCHPVRFQDAIALPDDLGLVLPEEETTPENNQVESACGEGQIVLVQLPYLDAITQDRTT